MAISNVAQRAENLIDELGISSASDIDVEAIAFDSGIDVLYEVLDGCEATLVGVGSNAIATVRPSSSRGRERFSVAHEIGHWLMHRGKSFRCRADDFVQNYNADIRFEKEADEFASHLLMPTSIFRPAIRALNKPGLHHLQEIAKQFEVSLQAVSIRLATLDTLPVIVACYTKAGLRWQIRAPHVPRRWWLRSQLDDDSFAYDVLHEGKLCNNLGKQPGETWFENEDADKYEVLEHSMPSTNGHVLVLLYLNDPEMFEVKFDPNMKLKRFSNTHFR
ncbi:MAG TPA: ImmA/IrrE family metallo-endopeptidase [Gallionella sp.]|nr:ImmA/IrrE family metallo-endopeptidase [Gallionella sp.]